MTMVPKLRTWLMHTAIDVLAGIRSPEAAVPSTRRRQRALPPSMQRRRPGLRQTKAVALRFNRRAAPLHRCAAEHSCLIVKPRHRLAYAHIRRASTSNLRATSRSHSHAAPAPQETRRGPPQPPSAPTQMGHPASAVCARVTAQRLDDLYAYAHAVCVCGMRMRYAQMLYAVCSNAQTRFFYRLGGHSLFF